MELKTPSLTAIEDSENLTVDVDRINQQLGWIAKGGAGLRIEVTHYDYRGVLDEDFTGEIEIFSFGDNPDAAVTALCHRFHDGFFSAFNTLEVNAKRLDVRGDINKVVTL